MTALGWLGAAVVGPETVPPADPVWSRTRPRAARAAWLAALAVAEVCGPDDHGAPLACWVGDTTGDPEDVARILRASAGPDGLDWVRLATDGAHAMHPLSSFPLMNHMTLCFASILARVTGPGAAVLSRGGPEGVEVLAQAAAWRADGAEVVLLAGADDPTHPLAVRERGGGNGPAGVALRLGAPGAGRPAIVGFGTGPVPAGSTEALDPRDGAAGWAQALRRAADRVSAGERRVVVVTPAVGPTVAGLPRPGPTRCGHAVVERWSPPARPRPPRPPRREVVITAVGAVCAFGVGADRLWAAIDAATTALGPLRILPRAPWPLAAAGEVPAPATVDGLPAGWVRDRKVAWALRALAELGPLDPDGPVDWAVGLEQAFLEDFGGAWGALPPRAPGEVRYRSPADLVPEVVRDVHGLRVPPVPHTAACAGGVVALAAAARRIRDGEADEAVAGAADCLLAPLGVLGMARLGAPSPTGRCRPFDRDRDGIVLAEGAACFRLEWADAAARRGRRPLAVVAGAGASMDAWSPSAPEPTGRGARAAMAAALDDAGLPPTAVGWVKAHGTGTPANDAAEATAIRALFGDRVPVSSFKGAFGHALAAAGALEVVAGLRAFARDHLPGTVGLDRPDPTLGVDVLGPAGRADRVDAWIANSFGFGGQNAAVVLRRPGSGRRP